jgi:PTH1 family peptidyl-tRNA hydrolase
MVVSMKMVVGLGNPGSQYTQTRHNVGFRCVDKLADNLRWKWERQNRAMITSGLLANEKVILVKPITFMNNSGEAVSDLLRWYKLQPEDLLVVCDDLDLPVGKIRLRASGSAGGHNGVDSIIHHLHTNQFPRLRIGIGRPAHQRQQTVNYVLGVPPLEERIQLEAAEDQVVTYIPLAIGPDFNVAMNIINTDPEARRRAEEKRRQQQERRAQAQERKEAATRQQISEE